MATCILRHRGVQLILAYSWARLATLVAGKGRGRMFLFSSVSSLSFLFLFLPCPCFSSPLLSLLSLFSLSLGDDTKWPTRVDLSLKPNTIKIHVNCILWREFAWDVSLFSGKRENNSLSSAEFLQSVVKVKYLRSHWADFLQPSCGLWCLLSIMGSGFVQTIVMGYSVCLLEKKRKKTKTFSDPTDWSRRYFVETVFMTVSHCSNIFKFISLQVYWLHSVHDKHVIWGRKYKSTN